MSTIAKPTQVDLLPVKYSIADKQIAELREQYKGLSVATKEGYEAVRLAIATTRKCRVEIEKQRKELKEDALAWGRKVDSEAKRLVGLLEEIENPLQEQKDSIDQEVERIRKAKADAARKAIEDVERAKREAEEAERRKQCEAEEAKLKADREALAAERKKMEAEHQAMLDAQKLERERLDKEERIRNAGVLKKREEMAAEQQKIDSERRAIDAEKQRLLQAEVERQFKINAAQEARERIERERIAREKAEAEAAEAVKREAARVDAMQPDVEKIREFAKVLRAIAFPKVESEKARLFLCGIDVDLEELAARCEEF